MKIMRIQNRIPCVLCLERQGCAGRRGREAEPLYHLALDCEVSPAHQTLDHPMTSPRYRPPVPPQLCLLWCGPFSATQLLGHSWKQRYQTVYGRFGPQQWADTRAARGKFRSVRDAVQCALPFAAERPQRQQRQRWAKTLSTEGGLTPSLSSSCLLLPRLAN